MARNTIDPLNLLHRKDSALSSSLSSTRSEPMPYIERGPSKASRSSSRSSREAGGMAAKTRASRVRHFRSVSSSPLSSRDLVSAGVQHEQSWETLCSGASSPYSTSPSNHSHSRTQIGPHQRVTSPVMVPSFSGHALARSHTAPSPPSQRVSDLELAMIDEKSVPLEEEYSPPPVEIIHWTSNETRRREYAEIDRANKGIRGLLKKMFPKLAAKTWAKFYDEKDGSTGGSVRRYRLDLTTENHNDDCSTYEAPQG